MADSGANQLFELWKKQLEEGTQAWTRLVTQAPAAAPPIDPFAFWRPVLDQGLQAWARLFAQSPASPEVLGQAMSTEQFAKLMGQSLDQLLVSQAPLKKAVDQNVEQALQALNLPSRSQLTAVARQIVELEDRLERLEDMLGALVRRLDKEPR